MSSKSLIYHSFRCCIQKCVRIGLFRINVRLIEKFADKHLTMKYTWSRGLKWKSSDYSKFRVIRIQWDLKVIWITRKFESHGEKCIGFGQFDHKIRSDYAIIRITRSLLYVIFVLQLVHSLVPSVRQHPLPLAGQTCPVSVEQPIRSHAVESRTSCTGRLCWQRIHRYQITNMSDIDAVTNFKVINL